MGHIHKRTHIFALVIALILGVFSNPSWAADPIVVGRSLPLTGPLQSYGEAKRDGGDAYIEKVNKAGGVKGQTIKLVTLDDQYQPAKTVANLKEMAAQQMPVAFLGLFGVPTIAAALPVIAELKIPVVGLTSGTNAVRTPHNPYVFPVRASYADEARKLVGHVKTIGITKISIVYTDNPFGESVKDTLLEALKAEGLSASAFKMDPPGANAAKTVAEAVKTQPQAIFLTMLSQGAVPVIREVKKTSSRSQLYAFSPVDTTVLLKELGTTAAGLSVTQIVPIPAGIRIKVVSEYLQALTEMGRGTPSFYGLEGFIEAKVLVEGLRLTGTASGSAALVKALETMRDYDAGAYFVSYAPGDHVGSRFVEINVIDSAGAIKR